MASYHFILVVLVFISANAKSKSNNRYVVPVPEITIYIDGLEVVIPNENGIETVYFQSTVVEDDGDVKDEIISMASHTPTKDKWVLTTNYSDLKVGDNLNYWLYVKKDGIGYRKPSGDFKIEVIRQENINDVLESEVSTPSSNDTYLQGDFKFCPEICRNAIIDINDNMNAMQTEIETLRDVVKLLYQAVYEHAGNLSSIEEWAWN